jgi:DNA invertase Pin-like site-specific DNA recombinase
MTETAGIWIRVSSGDQQEENQLPDNLRYCAEKGYQVREPYYVVHGKSAYKGEQDPDWQRVVKDVKAGRIQVVVIWNVDRLDRQNILHAIPMVNAVLNIGGRIEFVTQKIDLTTMAGRIGFAIYCEQAHSESQVKSDRMLIKHNALRALNALVGRPPFGYRIICIEGCGPVNGKHQHPKTLEPDPKLSPYVLGMVDRVIAGHSFASVCDWLDAGGIKPTGKNTPMWQPKVIRDILRNPALIGRRRDGRGKTVLKFAPILTDLDKWRTLQHKLDNMPRKAVFADDVALLAGVIFCDKCKGIMHRRRVYNVRKDGSRQYNEYYRCDGTGRQPSTCRNLIPLADAHGKLDEDFSAVEDMPYYRLDFVPGRRDYQDEISDIEMKIDDLDKLDPDYMTKHAALYAELKHYADKEPEPGRTVPVDMHMTMGEAWASWDISGRRQYLLDHDVKVWVTPGTHDVLTKGLSVTDIIRGMGGMSLAGYESVDRERIEDILRSRGLDPEDVSHYVPDA